MVYGTTRLGILGLDAGGIVFDHDAGNSSSYGGSGQTWSNIVLIPSDGESQTAYDQYLGDDSVAGADDPTFNGVAGNESVNEYWSFAGAQFFSLKSGTNTTFLNSLHKQNAKFTALFWVETPSSFGSQGNTLFSTKDGTGNSPGVVCQISNNGNLTFAVNNGSGTTYSEVSSAGFISTSTIQLVGISFDEAAENITFYNSTSTETASGGYSGGTSNPAETKLYIGAYGGSSAYLANGTKLFRDIFYNKALTTDQMDAVYNSQKARYGL